MPNNVIEARNLAKQYVSDGCTEWSCPSHGLTNQGIDTLDVRKIRKTCVVVEPILVSVVWGVGYSPSDNAIVVFAHKYAGESMGFPGYRLHRLAENDRQAIVTIYRD